jgi:hypothetical protein
MEYSGRSVPIFAWKTDGGPVPLLTSDATGERVGDQAFVDGRAMHWDGNGWVLSMWKDFATWRRDEHYSSAVEQHEVVLTDSVRGHDEIDLREPAGSPDEAGRAADGGGLRGASTS